MGVVAAGWGQVRAMDVIPAAWFFSEKDSLDPLDSRCPGVDE
jgi:hypothetical protein